ncbi:MAG: recombinase family protein [Magnetococcales bacterium]|nr:recombinase family protein [Magnetococcales bacterium]
MDDQYKLPLRAAQYLRSATSGSSSIGRQEKTNREYAARNGMEIVRTYIDEGKSGLNMEDRDALKRMFEDIISGRADFDVLLIYDISRWGRFQDHDQSAYHEYLCRKHNIRIEYCGQSQGNTKSMSSCILKTVKQIMKKEYKRRRSRAT